MSSDNDPGIPQVRPGPIRWLTPLLRDAVETKVAAHLGRSWTIRDEWDYSEFACHRCAVVFDGSFKVFFKYSEVAHAPEQFDVELSGLRTLAEKAGVLIPQPVGIVSIDAGTLLIMAAVESVERGPRQWREIGRTLARIHQVKGTTHGFESDGFWGPLHQDNTPTSDWPTFFRDRRLLPLLRTAIDSGNLPSPFASQVEKLASRLPDLCGLSVAPTLLHGDAQQNNFISTEEGCYVIDPAAYYGHPEMDLALLDSFQPIPNEVFDGYSEEMPIDPGFWERRNLWRIPLYLAAVALEGPDHLNKLTGTLGKYL